MPFEDGDDTGRVAVESSPDPAPEITAGSRRRSVETSFPPPVFHPLAYRGVVADWPVVWREQWGKRANELEESGLSWRDAETQAFVEVWKLRRQQQSPQPPVAALAPLDAKRN